MEKKNESISRNSETKQASSYMFHNFPPFAEHKLPDEYSRARKSFVQRIFSWIGKLFSSR